jgi:hypothetical protein
VFLLHKAHYFQTHTYEGRRNTPLRGDWDLEGGLFKLDLPGPARREITPRFALVDTRHPLFVRGYIDEAIDRNWHPEEIAADGNERWRWTSADATLQLDNPNGHPVTIESALDGWTPGSRFVSLSRVGEELQPSVRLAEARIGVKFPVLAIPPGNSTLVLKLDPPAATVAGDSRPLGICVFRFTITPQK